MAFDDKLFKAGAGTLVINSQTNSGAGGTEVVDGILEVTGFGKLNSGDVVVRANASRNVILAIAQSPGEAPIAIDDTANVALFSSGANRALLNLNFSSSQSETVNSLTVDGVLLLPGTYNATTLPGSITGTGNLLVLIPEPSSAAFLLCGAGWLLGARMRRRKHGC